MLGHDMFELILGNAKLNLDLQTCQAFALLAARGPLLLFLPAHGKRTVGGFSSVEE